MHTLTQVKMQDVSNIFSTIKTHSSFTGAGELGQWLRPFVTLAQDMFGSQHLDGGSQPSLTPVPKDMTPFSYLCEH